MQVQVPAIPGSALPRPALAPVPGEARLAIARLLAAATVLSLTLVVGIGGWATFTEISGAVIAPGQLVVESEVKKVQHPTGGVVGALLVREGDHVKAGDVLVRLDETQTRANLDIVRRALDEAAARRARGEAERDGAPAIAFPAELAGRAATDPEVARLVEGEGRLFDSRQASRTGQKAQLKERTAQLYQEISGLAEQAAAKEREIALIGNELAGVRDLYAKNLVPLSRVTMLERDAARLSGERGQLLANGASARGKVAETKLQILQIDADMRSEVGKELAEIRGRWSELLEKRVAALDQLKRIDLRAPQDGTVHQMTVHTIGGLVTPSEPAMLIVPEHDQLVVEAKFAPQDIDNVRLGQNAVLRFPAFNTRTTPEIEGAVTRVSADLTNDPKTGQGYYTARLRISEEQKRRLGDLRLVSGMPVEAYIQIGARSVLSYLIRPLADQIAKAWKER
ncbi:HlyD family type I secretion periplasmic adaptor subunit [Methylobacterium sp. E-016]|uniref:HlyD family type I secretion periplasmic adaptor subunit n=1 Tax=Methylobacterium sp. E-016 TaxID=2836556 RepID=UPI001FB9E375|nr:HlyD family type I secretion periplasmic adaptor subunit [Methylobacterium sp. E-016]MCJ2077319.1 HlyD family type I secretion periplasmic adaptor subunit [Methylobacterium sp. E-016]